MSGMSPLPYRSARGDDRPSVQRLGCRPATSVHRIETEWKIKMALGNKGFASLVTSGEAAPEPRRPPKSGFLSARDNRLGELAAGGVTTRIHEAVDPAICRIWSGHNRDYPSLNEEICSDLLVSLRAQGRQEVPAIVRRIAEHPTFRFEVICGARRHWSVSWLREHDYPDFKFVIEPRELTDEEAFRIADLENRSRKDLSDYERASDYARAVERYYEGNQQRMADRLQVTKSWLSRYLDLARLPEEILVCFPSKHTIGISHAAALAPLLNQPVCRTRVLDEAATVAVDQQARRESAAALLPAAAVVARLKAAGRDKPKPVRTEELFKDVAGKTIVRAKREGRAGVVITLPAGLTADRKAVLDAIDRYLQKISGDR
jgi:ParB family chromosome partitioning protein